MIEYTPNAIHIPCDCKQCVKNEAVLELLKKRIEECKTNSNGISAKDDWVEYKFQIRLVPELQKILEGEKNE